MCVLRAGASDEEHGPLPANGRAGDPTLPGKDHALMLDHAGAVFQHGFVEDPVRWTLDADTQGRGSGASGAHRRSRGEPPAELLEVLGDQDGRSALPRLRSHATAVGRISPRP